MKTLRITTVLLSLLAMPALTAQNRFPKPEFTGGYKVPEAGSLPSSATHLEHSILPVVPYLQYFVLAMLLLFLLLSCYFVYRKRSRRGIFLMVLAAIGFFGFFIHGCICAVGSIQNVVAAIFNPAFPISPFVIGVFILPLLFALFAGRVFCGSVCPLGAIQDVVGFAPVKVVPWLDRLLRIIPLFYLGFGVLWAATGAGFIICRFDPFVGFYRMSAPISILTAGTALLLLGVFVSRPYCRYLCPYGVLLSWCSALSSRLVSVTPDECIRCRLCEDVCPVDAIMPPAPVQDREPLRKSLRRVIFLLLILPVITAAAGTAGYFLGAKLGKLHPKVELYRQVSAELAAGIPPQNDETLAFRSVGTPVTHLRGEVDAIIMKFRIGTGVLGVFLALAVMARLFNFSKRRENKDFLVDSSLCVCCGRCYSACPREPRNRMMTKEGNPT